MSCRRIGGASLHIAFHFSTRPHLLPRDLPGLVIMASQQQQIIDTIFSMKRKLLRKDDSKTPPTPLLRLG